MAHDTLAERHGGFGPGAGSATLQNTMLIELLRILEQALEKFAKPQPLYAWIKKLINRAAMRTVYGPENPFTDPSKEEVRIKMIAIAHPSKVPVSRMIDTY